MTVYLRILRDAKLILSSPLTDLYISDLADEKTHENLYLHKVGFLNVNHLSNDKWKLLKLHFEIVDFLFLMEC